MTLLILGIVLFFGLHLLPGVTELRGRLVARLGEGPYKGLFSLVAIVSLVILIWGYRSAPFVPVWDPPLWMRHVTMLLMIPAAILIVAAYVPGKIKSTLKHPFLAGVKLWAFAHLLSNGDLASMLLFGSFLAYGVYDRISVKRRQERGLVTVAATGPARNDAIAVGAGLAAYVLIVFWLHPFFGVPVMA